jgi:hypothetical protein
MKLSVGFSTLPVIHGKVMHEKNFDFVVDRLPLFSFGHCRLLRAFLRLPVNYFGI